MRQATLKTINPYILVKYKISATFFHKKLVALYQKRDIISFGRLLDKSRMEYINYITLHTENETINILSVNCHCEALFVTVIIESLFDLFSY